MLACPVVRHLREALCHPVFLLALAVLVRLVVAAGTLVPGRDSEHYLWMAERVAEGQFGAAFETVFHPVYSLLVATLLICLPDIDAVVAGQMVSCGLGALAVLPLFAVTSRLFGRRAAAAAGFLYAVGIWFARHPADCLSEGPFYLLVAGTVWLLTSDRRTSAAHLLIAGGLAGLAYGTRPEGAALILVGAPWLWLSRRHRDAVAFLAAGVATSLVWPTGYWWYGDGFTVTPKLGFNYAVGVGRAEDAASHYLGHLVQIPGELFEALGYIAVPMALVGLFLARPWTLRSPTTLIIALVMMQIAIIPLLRSHFRYLSGYGFLLLVFAGLTWRHLSPRLSGWPTPLLTGAVLLAVAGDLVRIPQERRQDRTVLIELGRHLAPQLRQGESLATDMPRLSYFSGAKPGPPREIPDAELLEWCDRPTTRFVAIVQSRSEITAEDLRRRGFTPLQTPPELALLIKARSIAAYERR